MYLAFSLLLLQAVVQFTAIAVIAHAMGRPGVGMICAFGIVVCAVAGMTSAMYRPDVLPTFYTGFGASLLFLGTSIAGWALHLTSTQQDELAEMAESPEIVTDGMDPAREPDVFAASDNRRVRHPGAVQPHRRRLRRRFRVPVLHLNEHAPV